MPVILSYHSTNRPVQINADVAETTARSRQLGHDLVLPGGFPDVRNAGWQLEPAFGCTVQSKFHITNFKGTSKKSVNRESPLFRNIASRKQGEKKGDFE